MLTIDPAHQLPSEVDSTRFRKRGVDLALHSPVLGRGRTSRNRHGRLVRARSRAIRRNRLVVGVGCGGQRRPVW